MQTTPVAIVGVHLAKRDLATIDGDIAKFEKTLRAKLFLFF